MLYLPLLNLLFLIILYRIHKKVFLITAVIEGVLNFGGIYWIYSTFQRVDNQFLYLLSLFGIGIIIVLIAFFVAAFLNHQELYAEHQ